MMVAVEFSGYSLWSVYCSIGKRFRISICHCGKCGKEFDVKWDVDYVSSYERSMGEEYEYEGEDTFYCPNCDNEIQGKLSIYEYPVGCFNYEQITDVEDSFDTKQSYFKEPMVAFFDL